MIPQLLKQDIEQFYEDILKKPKEIVTMTLTGRRGEYVGHRITYDSNRKQLKSEKDLDNLA